MGRVTIDINGKAYVIGCEDGRETHLRKLAERIDEKARQIAPDAGTPGEARLILMAALMLTDELLDAEGLIRVAEAKAQEQKLAYDRLQSRVVGVIEAAADRLDEMAPETAPGQPLLL